MDITEVSGGGAGAKLRPLFDSLLHQYHYLSHRSTVGENLQNLVGGQEGRPLASAVLSRVSQRLSRDWQAKYGHPIYLLETFVEQDHFTSAGYRAANWVHVGQTKGRSRQDRPDGTWDQVPVKDIYLYPLQRRFRQRLQGSSAQPSHQPPAMVIEIDAWDIRQRDDWGQTEAIRAEGKKPERWHWVYLATVFRLDHRGQTAGERAVITERGFVATRGGLEALTAQLYREAITRGLGQAQRVLVIAVLITRPWRGW